VVRDGSVITAGGATAGIDFALAVLDEIYGADLAEAPQLGLEYDPKPPFNSGSPRSARPEILARVHETFRGRLNERRSQAEEAARLYGVNAKAS
jgi:cyclohexyl-isocyanide hydratase